MGIPRTAINNTQLPDFVGAHLWETVFGSFCLIWLVKALFHHYKFWVDVPVVGRSGILSSWITAAKWQHGPRDLVQEGHEKHGDYVFKVATPNRWEVFICNENLVKEYKNLMDDQFSANAVTADMFQTKWTTPGAAEGIHKIPISLLAKALMWQKNRSAAESDPYFGDFVEEFLYAWDVETKFITDDWSDLPCFEVGTKIVAHLMAKALVGYPLCRDPEIISLFSEYGNAVPTSGFFIAMFPGLLKPLVARFCAAPRMAARLDTIFLEEMKQRRLQAKEKSTDIMSWIRNWTHQNEPGKYSELDITRSVASVVFGGIHTTTQPNLPIFMVLVHCLFELATRPEYVEPLRKEAEEAFQLNGRWKKDGLESMVKLDSFIKECQRYNPLDSGSLARCATKDFVFSNGLKIPKGTYVFAPNAPVLFDERNYPNAHEFDGYRFYRLGIQTGKPQDYRFVATNSKYLQFGDARHTCPGRYMAANEIRLMLAHILIHYDVGTRGNTGRPKNWFFKKILFPDMKGSIVLKPRSVSGK